MSTEREPWSKFYWADWLSDPKLRMCSPEARGVWMDILCVMHESDQPGYLQINGQPFPMKKLSKICGITHGKLAKITQELTENGVISVENGIFFNRRMVRDFHRSKTNRNNGRNGGNPALRGESRLTESDNQMEISGLTESDNPSDKSHVRAAQKPEARSQKPDNINHTTVRDSRTGRVSVKLPEPDESDPNNIFGAVAACCSLLGVPKISKADQEIIANWLDAYDFSEHVIPTIAKKLARYRKANGNKNPSSLAYFDAALRERKP